VVAALSALLVCSLCPSLLLLCCSRRRSEKTFGGEGFLITRPGGNVLVDSPRFNPVLAKRIQDMGGIKYIFLTHKCAAAAAATESQVFVHV
jgi:hypothetical protein